jgi:hypothetical protein
MHLRTATRLAAAALVAAIAACGGQTAAPAAPTPPDQTATVVSALNASVPTPQSPVNNERIAASRTAGPTLVATAAASAVSPQYRFRVFSDNGVVAHDSGLVSSLTWTVPVLLTPNASYTWRVRAEYQGLLSPWSAVASFSTPDALPAYNRPIGNWTQCGAIVKDIEMVACVHNAVRPDDTVSVFEVTKRVAWLRRDQGAGLLIKTSGENIITWQGISFSASRICFPDGHIYKLFIDTGIGGLNAPTFADDAFVDKSLYVPAIDPSKP